MLTSFLKQKRWASIVVAVTILFAVSLPQLYYPTTVLAASDNQSPGSSSDFALRLLHTNDTHSHLDNVAKRITAINENRTGNTILLDAGDVFSGSLYFTKFNGMVDLEFMNMAKYDAMAPGNHEFDKGPEGFEAFIKGANFPIVSANIDYSRNAGLSAIYKDEVGGLDNTIENGHIYPSVVMDVYGEKVGIFGLTTEDTVGLSSPGETIKFQDHIARAKATVKNFEDNGINKIIALTHLGYDVDLDLAAAVPGIDIIVGGHSHTKLPAPIKVDHNGEGPTIIVQTGEYGDFLGKLDVVFDSKGFLKSYDGSLLEVAKFTEDKTAQDTLNVYKDQLADLSNRVVGKADVDLVYEDANKMRLVRKEETNLGNLITDGMADMMKAKVKDLLSAEELKDVKGYIALQNGGGIRAGIKKGNITFGDVLTVLPFANSLVGLKVTGQELIDALENGVSDAPAEKGGFPHVSGLKYVYDSTKKKQTVDTDAEKITGAGERIQSVQIKNADGTYSPIDKEAYYMLATNSFTADGGDFYYSLKDAKKAGRYYEFYEPDYEVFTSYLEKNGTIKASKEGRITDLNSSPVVASTIKSIPQSTKDAKELTLPAVPAGFTISIKSSDKPEVIATNGKITHQDDVAYVNLVLTVQRTSDKSTADTSVIQVMVLSLNPSKSSAPATPAPATPAPATPAPTTPAPTTPAPTTPAPATPAPVTPAPSESDAASSIEKPAPTVVKMTLNSKQVNVNGKAAVTDVAPFVYKNTTYVPLRFLGEAIGAQVNYDAAKKSIVVVAGKDVLTLWIDKTYMEVNGVRKNITTPATVRDNRTVLPLRLVGEALGWTVDFNAKTSAITLSK